MWWLTYLTCFSLKKPHHICQVNCVRIKWSTISSHTQQYELLASPTGEHDQPKPRWFSQMLSILLSLHFLYTKEELNEKTNEKKKFKINFLLLIHKKSKTHSKARQYKPNQVNTLHLQTKCRVWMNGKPGCWRVCQEQRVLEQ